MSNTEVTDTTMGNEVEGGGNLVHTAIIGESIALAAHVKSQLEQNDGFEVLWVCTPHLSQEYSLEGIDILVRAGPFSELQESLSDGSSTPVLFVCDKLPAAITDLVSSPGPIGAIDLEATAETVCAAAAALVQNLWVVSPGLLNRGADETAALTPRELDVLKPTALGMANREIAWELSISENTVKFHLTSIYAKLHVNNRVSAIRAAIDRGILDI